ncbi:MAG TPA: heavy metal-responsive transcriptional regulator [Candidatus Acidoferrales bacterium]|jgi:DNA-binding transcriptional MerR regulator|nr:heavy metal-responsive transcriptional regulator [Candidatus Acidoferrales bacterium]
MRIGQLAKQVGVNVQTVRFYERRGLLPEPTRKESGYRIYGPDDLHRMRFIRHAKTLGFSLNEIATILRMREKGKCPCGEVTKIGERHLQDLGQQIERLRVFYADLSRAVKTWKRLGEQRVSAHAFCVLIERTMDGAGKKERR